MEAEAELFPLYFLKSYFLKTHFLKTYFLKTHFLKTYFLLLLYVSHLEAEEKRSVGRGGSSSHWLISLALSKTAAGGN